MNNKNEIYNSKSKINILICLLFKNSNLWMNEFMECIEQLLKNSPDNINYDISIIYGISDDGTEYNLNRITEDLVRKYDINIDSRCITIPDRLDGIYKLVTLRNSFIYLNNDNLKDYKYLLLIDTDVMFTYGVILKLIRDIENSKLNAGVVAPMIFIDNHKTCGNKYFYDTFAYRLDGMMFTHTYPHLPKSLTNYKKRIIEVDSVGSLYIVRTDIFTEYGIDFETYERDTLGKHPQRKLESEQVVFCNEIRHNTPYKIYVDLNTKVFHVNLERYGLAWH